MTSTTSMANNNKPRSALEQFLIAVGITALAGSLFVGILVVLWFMQTPAGTPISHSLQSLFAINTVQAWWYVTRAAGLTSYFLLWLSMAWGMVIPSKLFHPFLEGTFSYDFHEFLSLLGLGFVLLHVVVLMLDQYLPFSIWELLIPFVDTYRPLWVGLGIIGFYLFLLVTITFYMRRTIGLKAFRRIHLLSIAGYLGASLHGLFAGTDSALPVAKLLYAGTFLVIIFLTVYWAMMSITNKFSRPQTIGQGRSIAFTKSR